MNLRNLFRVLGVMLGLGGLVWLLAPQSMAGAAGYTIDPYAAYLIRALGANTIAFAVLAFLAGAMEPSPARQAVSDNFHCADGGVLYCKPHGRAQQHYLARRCLVCSCHQRGIRPGFRLPRLHPPRRKPDAGIAIIKSSEVHLFPA